MTATINASTSSGVIVTSDTSGSLALQTANTTAMTINSSQVVNFANAPTIAGGALPIASGGTGLTSLGTAGQVLSVNSGATGLQYSTIGSSAVSLISTNTASGGYITFTGLSGYNNYMLILDQVVYSSFGSIGVQIGYGSTTWITSNYDVMGIGAYGSTAGNIVTNYMIYSSSASNTLSSFQLNNRSPYGVSGVANIFNFTNGVGVVLTSITGGIDSNPGDTIMTTYSNQSDTNVHTAIRVTNAGGGKASLYGISS